MINLKTWRKRSRLSDRFMPDFRQAFDQLKRSLGLEAPLKVPHSQKFLCDPETLKD